MELSLSEVVQLEFKGMWITLNALRNQRELVIYNRWWFVNSTGLDVRLLQPGGPGPMHPVASFSNKAERGWRSLGSAINVPHSQAMRCVSSINVLQRHSRATRCVCVCACVTVLLSERCARFMIPCSMDDMARYGTLAICFSS